MSEAVWRTPTLMVMICPACESMPVEHTVNEREVWCWGKQQRRRIYRCRSCGFVFLVDEHDAMVTGMIAQTIGHA
jgi:hypothetical protein